MDRRVSPSFSLMRVLERATKALTPSWPNERTHTRKAA